MDSVESRTGLSFRFLRREAQAVRLWAHKPLKDNPVRLSLLVLIFNYLCNLIFYISYHIYNIFTF